MQKNEHILCARYTCNDGINQKCVNYVTIVCNCVALALANNPSLHGGDFVTKTVLSSKSGPTSGCRAIPACSCQADILSFSIHAIVYLCGMNFKNIFALKKKLFFLFSILFVGIASFACGGLTQQVFTGEITYRLNPADPYTCTVMVVMDFDVKDSIPTDSIFIDWGDDQQTSINAISIVPDTLANLREGFNRFYIHSYAGSHTYGALGEYHANVIRQYRLNNLTNISSGVATNVYYSIDATVVLDTVAAYAYQYMPVLSRPLIGYGYINAAFNQNSFLYEPDGDSLSFEFITPLESPNSPLPLYELPDAFCSALGQPAPLTINHSTGEINWTNPCYNGVYAIAVRISKFRNGHFLGSIMRDQDIFVDGSSPTGIQSIDANSTLQLFPNPASSFIQVETDQPLSLSIINVLGETVHKQQIQSTSTIDISALSKGIYFIRYENNSFIKKFVKE